MQLPADLPTTARDYSDTQLDAVIAHYDMRRQPQPLPPLDYAAHTAECAPDDDDGPDRDGRAMGMLVLVICAACVAGLIALAVAFWPK